MNSLFMALFQWCPLFLLFFSASTSVTKPANIFRNGPLGRTIFRQDPPSTIIPHKSSSSKVFKTYFYEQTLDHFNYNPQSYTKFKQRYMMSSEFWGGAAANSPILAFLGSEGAIDHELHGIGFLDENAPPLRALMVYVEHRFYGKSIPFGSIDKAAEHNAMGYFNSAQSLADYAEVLMHVKRKLSAHHSPIIVVGVSYGGMLATWFRLKYPHIAIGALASSAPILNFDHVTPQDGFHKRLAKNYKEASESCYKTIKKSWDVIKKVASRPNGLSILSKKFKTCSKLKDSSELVALLLSTFELAGQYDAPPDYPVNIICDGIDGAPKGTGILGQIHAGFVALSGGNLSCISIKGHYHPEETSKNWAWQSCTEMVMPQSSVGDHSLFPPQPFNLKQFMKYCKSKYGVLPRPYWVTTYYGGYDIKLVLSRFASNIIFSNGLRDPYSSGGVLEDISDTIRAIYTANGSHGLDLLRSNPTDPEWLVKQRKNEVHIIEGWIKTYYADLASIVKNGKKLD